MRPEKQLALDETFLEQTLDFGDRFSHDPKYKVAAMIVNNITWSPEMMGVNGRGAGRPNERWSLETGCSGFAHAEANAMAKMDWDRSCTYTLVLPMTPCILAGCSSLILNQPITRVVYRKVYEGAPRGLQDLQGSGRNELIHRPPVKSRAALAKESEEELAFRDRLLCDYYDLTFNYKGLSARAHQDLKERIQHQARAHQAMLPPAPEPQYIPRRRFKDWLGL